MKWSFLSIFGRDEPRQVPQAYDDFWYTPVSNLHVTPDLAIQVSAVFACLKVLGETMGMLPLPVYERTGEGQKRRAYDVPEYRLLNLAPNAWQTPFEFKELMTAWAALWGFALAVKRIEDGITVGLDPIHPSRITVKCHANDPTSLRFVVQRPNNDGTDTYLPTDVLLIRGFSVNGLLGERLTHTAREAIALARSMEEFGARYFSNDTTIGLALEHPGKLTDPARKHLADSFEKKGGVRNAFRPMVLEEGMKLNRIQAVAKDAQLTEGRLHQVVEICRYFRMPPHKIAHLMQATFSNIEHQSIEFVTDTIQPWATRWEEAVTRDIIVDDVRYFAEFLLAAILRGDAISRGQYLQMRMQNGTLTANEWRALDNENPVEGGDTRYVNAALLPLDERGRPLSPQPADASPSQTASARVALVPVIEDAADRIARAEIRELEKRAAHAKADLPRFHRWAADEFFPVHHAYAERTLVPVVDAWTRAGGASLSAADIATLLVRDGLQALQGDATSLDATINARRASVRDRLMRLFSCEDLEHAA